MKLASSLPHRLGGLLAALALLGGAGQAAQAATDDSAPRYRLRDLGTLPGGYPGKPVETWALDINNRGDVVGMSLHHDGLNNVGFLYRDGRLQPIRDAAGRLAANASGINDHGDIAASSPDIIPVVYRADGRVTDLRAGLGSQWRYGDSMFINNAGWVAGQIYGPGTPTYVTFLYDGARTRLLNIPGVSAHLPLALNDAGEVLVEDFGSFYEQYLYRNGQATRLPQYSHVEGDFTAYNNLNDAGQLIGTHYTVAGGNRGFIYDRDRDSFHFLGERGDGSPYPVDINEHGWAVGHWDGHGGFLYRDGQLHAFNDLLVRGAPAGLVDLSLQGINDAGQLIAMAYRHTAQGWEMRSFIANPVPEAAAATQWLAGLALLGWATRRRPSRAAVPAARA